MDLVKFYEKYCVKYTIFLFVPCLTGNNSCDMILNNKMDNCIVNSVFLKEFSCHNTHIYQ